ncbi:MAG: hypothetical protein JJ960_17510 [Kordiimonadaceae bacterium]|nr:hypothetical protein [Kordiimonadaceae bacterium]
MVAKKNILSNAIRMATSLVIGFAAFSVNAGDLVVTAKNTDGDPLEFTVVQLTPKFETSLTWSGMLNAEMRQQNTLFQPFVLPVKVGTSVSFPNLDEARHHVYSFSRAKPFELRLYGKDESNSITFDNAGVVALGCNIHDNMLAYIYVTEAPIYLTTGPDGTITFSDLENGSYELSVWHPGQKDRDNSEAWSVDITGGQTNRELTVDMRRVWGQQRQPAEGQY